MTDVTLVYGLHAVGALLARDAVRISFLQVQEGRHDERLAGVVAAAKKSGVELRTVARHKLDETAGGARHQGVIAHCSRGASFTEADLDSLLDAGSAPLLLVLDGVQDPHNLGACLRSADAAGVTAVIAPRDRATGLTPVVRKVACGAAESVPFIAVTNLARTLRDLQQRGIWITGLAGDADIPLVQADLTGARAVVLGAEGTGLRRLTREVCDQLVTIPMHGAVSSLNVSVAAGVVLFEAVRQRDQVT